MPNNNPSIIRNTIITAVFLLVTLIRISSVLAGEYPRTFVAWKGSTPVLDGTISSGEWEDAEYWPGVAEWNGNDGPPITSEDLSLTVWMKHDGTNLYIAFDVNDSILYGFDTDRFPPDAKFNQPAPHELTQAGWPWYGDGIEVMIHAANTWGKNDKRPGDGSAWQMVCSTHKSRVYGLEAGGLLEGEPRVSDYAWNNYQQWILNGDMDAVVRIKSHEESRGYVIEWMVKPNPCLEVAPGTFWDPANGVTEMGLTFEIEDLDTYEPDRMLNMHHILLWASSVQKALLKNYGTLRIEPGPMPARTIYVDSNATGLNNGTSWANAMVTLQDALDIASAHDEIRIAQGTYQPDQGASRILGDPNATFRLMNGLVLQGGYAGVTQIDPNEQDARRFVTVLTGDLLGNDNPNDPATRIDNSWTVVTADNITACATLSDLTLAHGTSPDSGGGGAVNSSNSDCNFVNCSFSENSASKMGGAFLLDGGRTVFTNCSFTNNRSGEGAGAIIGSNGDLTLIQCVFSGNQGAEAGAIDVKDANAIMDHCLFHHNTGGYSSGAVSVSFNGQATLNHCTLYGNVRNGNSAGTLYTESEGRIHARSSILWANSSLNKDEDNALIVHGDNTGPITFDFCCIQGWTPDLDGLGNIATDPLFANPNGGDFHLCSKAGRWDPVQQTWVQDVQNSPCIDAGDPNSPLALESSPNGCVVNMGVFGGTPEASLSDPNGPTCDSTNPN